MRRRILPLLILAVAIAFPALAQTDPTTAVPPGADPTTGARPGNTIGTGMSLPVSDRAGNITARDTASPIAARLPDPSVDDNATIHDFLIAARNALVTGRTGEAQETLERAETRLLDRSVPLFQTSTPSQDPMAERIARVLHALGDGDRLEAVRLLEQAIGSAGE